MPMLRPDHIVRDLLVGIILLGALGAGGCEKGPADPESLKPWQFESQTAGYRLEVPGQWTQIPVEEINRFADVALTVDHQLYLIVIPQQLPRYEGVEPPDALDLKRASVGLLKERVTDFTIEREGPVQLGNQSALSIFAHGVSQEVPVQYITTYAAHDNWGFQIIAWGPTSARDELIGATDRLLAGWSFKGSTLPTSPESISAAEPAGRDAPGNSAEE